MLKELFIIRHAKSSWEHEGISDFDRPLNQRGEEDAPLMGSVLRKNAYKPDFIIASPAKRTLTTAKIIAEKFDYEEEKIVTNAEIYEASYHDMLALINEIDDRYNRVFLVGHNPTFTNLAERLGGEYIGNLPTCGIVGLRFNFKSWQMVTEGGGLLFYYDYPKRNK